jgi:hypothetical protein
MIRDETAFSPNPYSWSTGYEATPVTGKQAYQSGSGLVLCGWGSVRDGRLWRADGLLAMASS